MKMRSWLGLLAVLIVLGVIGKYDADAQAEEDAHYCEMVKAHAWPDYRGTYRRDCPQPKTVRR